MKKPDWVRGSEHWVTCGTHNISKVCVMGIWAYEAWRLPITQMGDVVAAKTSRDIVAVKLGCWPYGADEQTTDRALAFKDAVAAVELDLENFSHETSRRPSL